MDDLIKRIKETISGSTNVIEYGQLASSRIFPVADETTLQNAEELLGFRLPLLLRRLYLEIGNGGFGPSYGLIGVAGGATTSGGSNIVDLYQSFAAPDPADVRWQWPKKLLPVSDLGCAMYACIDCSTEAGAVIWYEPNLYCDGEPLDNSLIPLTASTAEWLEAWLEGKDLFEVSWERKFA